jgi:hypothetical protein
MECQRLRGEGAHRANGISQNLSLACIQRHKNPSARWRCNGHGRRGVAKERGRPNTAHAVGTCTVLWRPRSPANTSASRRRIRSQDANESPPTPLGPVGNLVPRFRGRKTILRTCGMPPAARPHLRRGRAGALDDARVARAASAEARLALGGVRLGQPMGPWRFPESCHPPRRVAGKIRRD